MKLELDSLSGSSTREKIRRAILQVQAQRQLYVGMLERKVLEDASNLQDVIRRVQQPKKGWTGRLGQYVFPKASINSMGELQNLHGALDQMVGAIMMCDEFLELLTDIYNRPA